MIPADLLELLRCPATRQKLTVADDDLLTRLNANADLVEPVRAALVRADGTAAYPVRGDIPVLLVDKAIPL